MNRELQYIATAGPTTSASLIAMGRITFTGTEGDRYLVIGTVAVGAAANAFEVGMDDIANGGIFYQTLTIAPRDTTNDMYSVPFIFPYQITFTGADNFDMQLEVVPGAGGATARQAMFAVFKLNELDHLIDSYDGVGEVAANGNTTNTTYETITESTCTIRETGEYLVLASAFCNKNETTADFFVRLALNGTTGYGEQRMHANSTAAAFPWATMIKLSLTAGDVLTIEHKVFTTGTMITSDASIVALRCNMFPAVLYAEDLTTDADNSTTSTTYADIVDIGTTTFRTQAQPSLVLSCAQYRRGAASVDASMRTLYDGATVQESRNESVAATCEAVHFAVHGVTPTAGDHTIKQQWRSEGGGITAAIHQDSVVAVITMQDNATCYIRGGEIYKGQIR